MTRSNLLNEPAEGPRNLQGLLDDYERRLILLALEASGGHQRKAAASLGILPTTLSEKLRRLGLRSTRRLAAGVPVAAGLEAGAAALEPGASACA